MRRTVAASQLPHAYRLRTLAKPAPVKPDRTQARPSAKWYEKLLSQDRLKEALDASRDYIDLDCRPQVLATAQRLAWQAVNGQKLDGAPPQELVQALTKHFADLYRLGHDTVRAELHQHASLIGLDRVPTVGTAPSVFNRAIQAAVLIVQRIVTKLQQWMVNHHRQPQMAHAQIVAQRAAIGALHEIALDHAAAQINEGRVQAAHDLNAAGAYRTAVLDNNTCGQCAGQDTGRLLTLPEAAAHPLPDPDCSGGDRCRCTYVFVMHDDPAAIAAGMGAAA